MEPAHATAVAAIVRALVERAAQEWRARTPTPRLSATRVRLPAWRASESDVEATFLHPFLNLPCPAKEAVLALALLTHVRPALASSGGEEQVTLELARILTSGTGSRRQRETMMNSQILAAVVMEAVDCTHGTAKAPHHRSRRLQET